MAELPAISDTPSIDFSKYQVDNLFSATEWRGRFGELLTDLGVDYDTARYIAITVTDAYSSDERGYHGILHLTNMWNGAISYAKRLSFSEDETIAHLLAVPAHDIVYNPRLGSPKNEQQSAAWLRLAYTKAGFLETIVARSETLVLATAEHKFALSDIGMCAFLDEDMWILQAPREIYARYAAGVYKEYVLVGGVVPADYATRRADFLRGQIARGQVFSGILPEYVDARAIANMEWELELFESAGGAIPPEIARLVAEL